MIYRKERLRKTMRYGRKKVVSFGIFTLSGVIAAVVVLTPINGFFLKGARVCEAGTHQLAARPVAAKIEPGKDEITREGSVIRISRSLAERLKADKNLIMYSIAVKLGANGVKIVSVDRGSIAQRMGIAPGDTIREVNGRALSSTEDMSGVYEALKDATSFDVRILRRGRSKILRYEIKIEQGSR
jgi:membrane-associated protease RseP (regulator of RpoE activity)